MKKKKLNFLTSLTFWISFIVVGSALIGVTLTLNESIPETHEFFTYVFFPNYFEMKDTLDILLVNEPHTINYAGTIINFTGGRIKHSDPGFSNLVELTGKKAGINVPPSFCIDEMLLLYSPMMSDSANPVLIPERAELVPDRVLVIVSEKSKNLFGCTTQSGIIFAPEYTSIRVGRFVNSEFILWLEEERTQELTRNGFIFISISLIIEVLQVQLIPHISKRLKEKEPIVVN